MSRIFRGYEVFDSAFMDLTRFAVNQTSLVTVIYFELLYTNIHVLTHSQQF